MCTCVCVLCLCTCALHFGFVYVHVCTDCVSCVNLYLRVNLFMCTDTYEPTCTHVFIVCVGARTWSTQVYVHFVYGCVCMCIHVPVWGCLGGPAPFTRDYVSHQGRKGQPPLPHAPGTRRRAEGRFLDTVRFVACGEPEGLSKWGRGVK